LEKTNPGARRKLEKPKGNLCGKPKPEEKPRFWFSLFGLYIEAFKSFKTKSPNLMGKVKRGLEHVCDRSETQNEFMLHAGSCP
jgi:hypothetical protein